MPPAWLPSVWPTSLWPFKQTKIETWIFRKQWRNADNEGDIYQDNLQRNKRETWKYNPTNSEDLPYLQYLKAISPEWPQLRVLADFMEVGTDPSRWKSKEEDDQKSSKDSSNEKESDRLDRTKVCRLDYLNNGSEWSVRLVDTYTTPDDLKACLGDLDNEKSDVDDGEKVGLTLFVVEDLSRHVIGLLGHHFDIDPNFFRAHILDHIWYNIRSAFWNPPSLYMDTIRRDWFQIRFCRARYFSSQEDFKNGQEAADNFNVVRKLYGDENKAFWDRFVPPKPPKPTILEQIQTWFRELGGSVSNSKPRDPETLLSRVATGGESPKEKRPEEQIIDGSVGLMRTKATYWEKKATKDSRRIGILLLDPTIKEGFRLWRGYRNWGPTPPVTGVSPAEENNSEHPAEMSFFEDFTFWAQKPDHPIIPPRIAAANDHCLPVLVLFRLVCAEWLTLSQYIKTRLSQIDWEITHPEEFLVQRRIDFILNKLHTWRRLVPVYREMLSETMSRPFVSVGGSKQDYLPGSRSPEALDGYQAEFAIILHQMEEYEHRIDRLTTVVTSSISIADSRRVERLTLLATLFVPLSLVGTLFSMTDDITQISDTFGYWAAASFGLLIIMFIWTWRTQELRAK